MLTEEERSQQQQQQQQQYSSVGGGGNNNNNNHNQHQYHPFSNNNYHNNNNGSHHLNNHHHHSRQFYATTSCEPMSNSNNQYQQQQQQQPPLPMPHFNDDVSPPLKKRRLGGNFPYQTTSNNDGSGTTSNNEQSGTSPSSDNGSHHQLHNNNNNASHHYHQQDSRSFKTEDSPSDMIMDTSSSGNNNANNNSVVATTAESTDLPAASEPPTAATRSLFTLNHDHLSSSASSSVQSSSNGVKSSSISSFLSFGSPNFSPANLPTPTFFTPRSFNSSSSIAGGNNSGSNNNDSKFVALSPSLVSPSLFASKSAFTPSPSPSTFFSSLHTKPESVVLPALSPDLSGNLPGLSSSGSNATSSANTPSSLTPTGLTKLPSPKDIINDTRPMDAPAMHHPMKHHHPLNNNINTGSNHNNNGVMPPHQTLPPQQQYLLPHQTSPATPPSPQHLQHQHHHQYQQHPQQQIPHQMPQVQSPQSAQVPPPPPHPQRLPSGILEQLPMGPPPQQHHHQPPPVPPQHMQQQHQQQQPSHQQQQPPQQQQPIQQQQAPGAQNKVPEVKIMELTKGFLVAPSAKQIGGKDNREPIAEHVLNIYTRTIPLFYQDQIPKMTVVAELVGYKKPMLMKDKVILSGLQKLPLVAAPAGKNTRPAPIEDVITLRFSNLIVKHSSHNHGQKLLVRFNLTAPDGKILYMVESAEFETITRRGIEKQRQKEMILKKKIEDENNTLPPPVVLRAEPDVSMIEGGSLVKIHIKHLPSNLGVSPISTTQNDEASSPNDGVAKPKPLVPPISVFFGPHECREVFCARNDIIICEVPPSPNGSVGEVAINVSLDGKKSCLHSQATMTYITHDSLYNFVTGQSTNHNNNRHQQSFSGNSVGHPDHMDNRRPATMEEQHHYQHYPSVYQNGSAPKRIQPDHVPVALSLYHNHRHSNDYSARVINNN